LISLEKLLETLVHLRKLRAVERLGWHCYGVREQSGFHLGQAQQYGMILIAISERFQFRNFGLEFVDSDIRGFFIFHARANFIADCGKDLFRKARTIRIRFVNCGAKLGESL
jgi:hypothetical protein